jgi:hypothetical protein
MLRGLSNPDANDLHGYYDLLLGFARQYLKACRTCDIRCEPHLKQCGYSEEASGLVRFQHGRVWEVSGQSDLVNGNIWFTRKLPATERIGVSRAESCWLNPRYALDWQIDGEPLPQLHDDSAALPAEVYNGLIPGGNIIDENLQRSFSGLCLAGRIAGEAASLKMYSSIRFRLGETRYALPELLSIHGWNNTRRVSRMTYFNARTERIDRASYSPSLTVADGDLSFLKVLSNPRFQRSDVVGVIHRAIERDNLDSVGNRMLGLHQWYEEDTELINMFQPAPRGISFAILRRRTH